VAATNGAATVINSHKSHDSRFLTKVLYDRLIPVEAAGTPRVVKINIPIPDKWKHVQYLASTTNVELTV